MGSSLFGYAVASELPLERLTDAPGPRGDLRLVRASRPLLADEGELLSWAEVPESHQWLALARTPAGVLGACSQTGAFLVEWDARRVQAEPSNGTDDAWQHRMLATALPLLVSGLGDLVLHASGVMVEGGAVLFCGPSGRGKSTLALHLARAGRPVLGEDGIAVALDSRPPRAWPGPHGVRLADAPGEAKRTHNVESRLRMTAPAPVLAVVALRPREAGDVVVERLDPIAGARTIISSVMCAPGSGFARAFVLAARLSETVPVFRARLPDDLGRADAAARELVARIEAQV
jgi:hypothetical protein